MKACSILCRPDAGIHATIGYSDVGFPPPRTLWALGSVEHCFATPAECEVLDCWPAAECPSHETGRAPFVVVVKVSQ